MLYFNKKMIKITACLMGLFIGTGIPVLWAESRAVEAGKVLTFDRKKGNCLSCHVIAGGTLMGTTGPPLMMMKLRFPDKEKLYKQVFDARKRNQKTIMPPFGSHAILSKEEVGAVVEYLYTL